ncbi:Transcription factor MADS-box [Arabidopsis suecica]|uniref:Transcription factor MADS-box n=1 Tax=Arabidopsis suecica TaxID=45249 RepID=A0A8T1ZV78_ARASU|nr:Transcription factor MADS-box [Arabidopsis suecica]
MGRGKVELKRIENKINRQVTFAKRRNGLLKKAYELSVLCDAEIALLIFSNRGKLYEFCSSPSGMAKTVDKYRKYSYATMDPNQSAKDLQDKYQDYLKLKSRVEILQHSQRHLLGEELAEMDVNELEQLERQVDASLRQIRSTKARSMLDQLSDLKTKEEMLLETNRDLRRKLDESDAALTQSFWGGSAAEHSQQQQQHQQQQQQQQQHQQQGMSSYQSNPPIQEPGFFKPIQGNVALQMSSHYNHNPAAVTNASNSATTSQNVNGFFPGWMV